MFYLIDRDRRRFRFLIKLFRDRQRKLDFKRRSQSFARTLGADRPAMHFDQVSHDRQPESQAAMFPGDAAVSLSKPVENIRQEFRARFRCRCQSPRSRRFQEDA
jgi:hypothetical protein